MAGDTEKDSQEQSELPGVQRPKKSAGDTITAQVGEEAEHVAVGKNIIQIGSLSIPRWMAIAAVAILALATVLVGVVAYFSHQSGESAWQIVDILSFTPTPTATVTPVPTLIPTPLPFAPAKQGETLIVIAPFHISAGNRDTEPHRKIWRRIQQQLATLQDDKIKVEIDPNVVLSADQRPEAEAWGKRYNASMVIWGEDTGVETIINFLDLREPDFEAAYVSIDETERTQLAANPDPYNQFITHDLPGQMTFLALFSVGNSYYSNGQYEPAITNITAGLEALDASSTPPQGLSDAYFRLGWLHHQPPEDLDQAIADYTQAITLDPKRANTYINRGSVYYRKGDLDQAMTDYTQAITLDPKLALAYVGRGIAYYAKGDLDQAIADYTQAITLDPKLAGAYINRGIAYYAKGDLDQAIADWTQAITLDPKYAEAYNALCWNLALLEQPERAMPFCEKAVALAEFPPYIDSRGLAHALLGEFPDAIADFQVFADWLAVNYPGETHWLEQRRTWIEVLKQGKNPFTPEVLKQLLNH